MQFRTPVPISRVIEMQGFDATVPAWRDVYVVLSWNTGRTRRTYKLDLIFDGDRCGLGAVLAEFHDSAVCVGRGSVRVGVDDFVSLTFARSFDITGQPAKHFMQTTRQSVSLVQHQELPPARSFGPFSARQQLYAASLIDAPEVSIYGFRARWAVGVTSIEERCFLLQAETPDAAVALLREHIEEEYPDVDVRQIALEMDNSRLVTIVSHFSLFSCSRVSQLDEYAFIESFRLGSVIEPG